MISTCNEWIAKDIGIMAPSAAPAETPKIAGSANGFLNKPCITAPDIDNATPIKKDKMIRGNLISRIIELLTEDSYESNKRIENVSFMSISYAPRERDSTETNKLNIIRKKL